MITSAQYFGDKPRTEQQTDNGDALLESVNQCLEFAAHDKCYAHWIDPDTGTQISGAKGGSGDGGFRLPTSGTGVSKSSHKDANGVDVFDPHRTFAEWCVNNKHVLAALGLYMEDPRWTPGWVHLQRVPPKSGKRVYIPSTQPALAPALPGQAPLPFVVRV
jgi:hypothetical protein